MIVYTSVTSCKECEIHNDSTKAELWDALVKMLNNLNSSSTNDYKRVSIVTKGEQTIIKVEY